ncbi:MAG: hypothetical protein WBX06_14350, partial [Acidobacteriaceae bacterium]
MFSANLKIALPVILALATTGFAQNPSTPPPTPAQTAPAATPAPAAPAAPPTAPKIEDQDSFIVVGVTVRTNNT